MHKEKFPVNKGHMNMVKITATKLFSLYTHAKCMS